MEGGKGTVTILTPLYTYYSYAPSIQIILFLINQSDMTGKTDFLCQKVNENEYSNTVASSKNEEKALGQNEDKTWVLGKVTFPSVTWKFQVFCLFIVFIYETDRAPHRVIQSQETCVYLSLSFSILYKY